MLIGQDVTNEYINSTTPMKGRILYENGYNYGCHNEEVKIAEWLYNNFGGNIILLSEKKGRCTPAITGRGPALIMLL